MDHWAGVPYVDDARIRAAVPGPRDEPAGERGADAELVAADELALVARHTDDAVVLYGPDGRISWVNRAFERITGFPAAEAVGADRLDLVRGPFTKTADFAALRADLAAGRDTSVEFVTRTREGASYWTSMDVRSVVRDGRVVALIGIERDITARRQAEERARQTLRRAESLGIALRHEKRLLSTVLAAIPHLVWWKNEDLRYVGANQAFLTFRGMKSPAEVVGRRDDQLSLVEDGLGAEVARLEAQVLASHRPVAEHTVTTERDGEPDRTFLVTVLPLLEAGEFAGVIGICADVTLVGELDRQLVEASRHQALGRLAAGIARDVDIPVRYISDNNRFLADSFRQLLDALQQIGGLVGLGGPDGTGWARGSWAGVGGVGAEAPDGDGDAVARLRRQVAEVLAGIDLGFLVEEVPQALEQSQAGLERIGTIVGRMAPVPLAPESHQTRSGGPVP